MNDNLRKLQLTQYEMLKVIDKIASKHGIKVFLNSGTMLGAVRHKGFIPWDDDLDVMVTRKDYEKLEKILKKELPKEYCIQSMMDENYGYVFSKIRKNNTLCVEEYAQDVDMHQGIWIDVFIYDNIPDNRLMAFLHYYKVKFYRYILILKSNFKLVGKPNIFVKIVYKLAKLYSKLYNVDKLKKKIYKLMTKYKDDNTKNTVSFGGNRRFYIESQEFESEKKLLFEDQEFFVTKNPDKYLSDAYGDYMTLPPEEKRINVHNLEKIVFDTTKKTK